MTKILNLLGPTLAADARTILRTGTEMDDAEPDRRTVLSAIASYEALLTGLDLAIDKELIDAAPRLRAIAIPATGLDHVDLHAAEARGIKVLSLRGEDEFLRTITPTAELAFGLMLALLRNILPAAASVERGEWNREAFRGRSVRGLTLGIVGMGRLGSMMARYGTAFGMRVLGCDPTVESDGTWERVDLNRLLSESDVVSLHVHLSDATAGLIGKKELNRMKPTAILINTARGKIVDEPAVIMRLRENKLGAYGADVLVGELGGDVSAHPLVQFARENHRVLITPHIGGMTAEARTATDMFIAEKLMRFLRERH